jgi:hypothetical protein
MARDLSPALRRRLGDTTGRLPVLIHLAQGATAEGLERLGVRVERVFESIGVVSATVAADEAALLTILNDDDVADIELDETAQALGI